MDLVDGLNAMEDYRYSFETNPLHCAIIALFVHYVIHSLHVIQESAFVNSSQFIYAVWIFNGRCNKDKQSV